MSAYAIHFSLGFVLSFIGSLPLGIINTTVAETTIRRGLRTGLWVAVGASLVEWVQAFVSIKFTQILTDNPLFERSFDVVALLVFLGLALYYFFLARPPAHPNHPRQGGRSSAFWKGVFVSSMNVLVIPYWIFYSGFLHQHELLQYENSFLGTFCLGVMLGTFALLALYAGLGMFILRKGERWTLLVNPFLGVLFLGLAVFQAWKVWE
ncbi:MAG: hypothetical protein D6765_00425 [Bacteroidetes bacterium]|nr:MAG: hypothetical protein D6765_00425 [Bacteroidota bacterium]